MLIRKLEEKDISECLAIYNYYIENTCFTLEEDVFRRSSLRTVAKP